MSQGDLRSRRSAQCSCDARNNLELDVGFPQSRDFFADAPEDHRITAFEAHDLRSRGGQSDHEEANLFLADFLFSATLADVVNLRVRRHEVKYLRADKLVVQHHISVFQHPSGLQGEQFGIAGSGADQIYLACHIALLLPFVFDSAQITASNASVLASDCRRSRLRSGLRLLARTLRRVSPNTATQCAYPGPNCCSSCLRSFCAKDGLCPEVEIAICRSPR